MAVLWHNSGMPPGITEEIIARQPPEAQAIIRALLAEIAVLRARVAELERQLKGKTPQNSSLPPSTQHPHARPETGKRKSKKKRGGQPGHPKIDKGDKRAKWLGERLRAATCELFEHWAEYRAGNISRAALVRRMGPVRRKVERLLLRGTQSNTASVRGTCRELYEHRAWLWTFLRHEGVEPTNNAGERSLRHAVIWRKLSFGTQSANGSRFVETMLTVIETCRQQRRNAFSFLTAAVQAHLAHQPAPSLLSGV
jgi:hypothetical protein